VEGIDLIEDIIRIVIYYIMVHGKPKGVLSAKKYL